MEESKPFFVKLKKRGLITISGPDKYEFLQRLVSNDISNLEHSPVLYSLILSPQGKFLFDFFIVDQKDHLVIDCEGEDRAKALYDELLKYKLRSKITLEYELKNNVYTIHNLNTYPNASPDPRNGKLGLRSFIEPLDIENKNFNAWDTLRIKLTIPDGSRDLFVNQSTILDFRIDELNGVSFEKGCFIGQEVTARMKHRGLVKKHLYCISISKTPLNKGDTIIQNQVNIGTMCSHCDNVGLALLKDEHVLNLWPEGHIVI